LKWQTPTSKEPHHAWPLQFANHRYLTNALMGCFRPSTTKKNPSMIHTPTWIIHGRECATQSQIE
jgi:hypothetical protein